MHNRRTDEHVSLTAQDCAERLGMSIRALRLYEEHGLISPSRTAKQWRLYGRDELVRLNEILALKTLGLSLRDIKNLLQGKITDLPQTLALQHDALTGARARANRGLQLIESLQAKIQSGAVPTMDDLTRLVKETQMTDTSKDSIAWRRYEQMRPRTETPIDPTLLDDYAGAYETADGTLSIVTRYGGKLVYRIVGQSDLDLFPESDSLFFMKVLPVQIAFHRDRTGTVDSLVHHQNGFADHAARIDLETALRLEVALEHRIQAQTPMPGGADCLKRIVETFARGEPDLDSMAPALAALIAEEQQFIRDDLTKAGALQVLTFKGIQHGLDIYDVTFEHGKLECGFAVTHRDKLSHLYLRPAL